MTSSMDGESTVENYTVLTESSPGQYTVLNDRSKWHDPAYNTGGMVVPPPNCGSICHYASNIRYLRPFTPISFNPLADSDGDGVADADDNCLFVPNTAQIDSDNDWIGDKCDNCRNVANQDQLDSTGSCSAYPLPYEVDPACGDACL